MIVAIDSNSSGTDLEDRNLIDLGTTTGWALHMPDSTITSGTISFTSLDGLQSVTLNGAAVGNNPAAPTKLVEYASYTCGHCAHFEIDDVPQIKNQFVASGKVSFEIRNLVRDPMDLTAAMLARCGGKGRFFGNHRQLMATQAQWANGGKLSKATIDLLEAKNVVGFMQGAYTELGLDKIMAQRGVTSAQAKVCLSDKAAFNAVIAMTDEATQTLKINSTPTLLVNGKIIEGHDFATIKTHLAP